MAFSFLLTKKKQYQTFELSCWPNVGISQRNLSTFLTHFLGVTFAIDIAPNFICYGNYHRLSVCWLKLPSYSHKICFPVQMQCTYNLLVFLCSRLSQIVGVNFYKTSWVYRNIWYFNGNQINNNKHKKSYFLDFNIFQELLRYKQKCRVSLLRGYHLLQPHL